MNVKMWTGILCSQSPSRQKEFDLNPINRAWEKEHSTRAYISASFSFKERRYVSLPA